MFEATISEGVLRVGGSDVRWLSTGWAGGFHRADAAYNVSVPEGWERTDLDAYVKDRRERAGFPAPGPALLTGVDLVHLRGARDGSIVVYATAGVSNPAALPMNPTDAPENKATDPGSNLSDASVGTVNLIVGTTRALDDSALASLLAVAVEAKTATLLAETGFTGTTTDAVVAGTTLPGEEVTFTGSATDVGVSTRACVRDAIRASLDSRYANRDLPTTVGEAKYGTVTNRRAEVFTP